MNKLLKSVFTPIAAGAMALSTSAFSADLPKRTLCVWDIVGKSGPVASQMEDYRLEAIKWGVDLELKVYTDEKIAAEDLKSGACDAAGITGLRAREFNSFTGTLDSIGSIPSSDHMQVVLQYLADPKLAKLMTSGEYEITGILPGGAAYLFTNDRTIDTVAELAGKKFAAMDFDKAQAIMIESVGASPVSVSLTNFGSMFNNGSVDIIGAPAVAYNALELYKGLGDNGAVINFSILQLTAQIVARHDRFPAGFGQSSREYAWNQYSRAMEVVNAAEKSIKPSYWLDLPQGDKEGYMEMFRQSRLTLRDQGLYDGKMLSFLSKVRCQKDPALAECTAKDRE
ncbi:putative solute-binding protein [Ketobacter alkanivorans]|uniref:RND transporter n=1 Tax=Ketobacter alkanivorans TaxID=1917421 RepID=A0A2K9LPL3_9GAMM|nr:putative solute-binding protein [Ketobacter alkanivorans]AUM14252.1 hypothetical protein Kalk_18290 [Ketobacter alkanivorans]MCP5018806.1 hypothetical protein [Ketobacter sp.]